jgi:hypothetical protein
LLSFFVVALVAFLAGAALATFFATAFLAMAFFVMAFFAGVATLFFFAAFLGARDTATK